MQTRQVLDRVATQLDWIDLDWVVRGEPWIPPDFAVPRTAEELQGWFGYLDALSSALGDVPCPIVFDVDIGHRPPQMTMIQGARAIVRCANGAGSVEQSLT